MEQLKFKHGDIIDLSLDSIIPNEWNPNEMTMDQFNMLIENINLMGNVQPIVVSPVIKNGKTLFRIIDGEHRFEAERIRDSSTIKAIYVDPEKINEVEQKFQTVKLNKIRGKLNISKFVELVSDLKEKTQYDYEELGIKLGFDSSEEFEKLIQETRKSLPTETLKKEFDKVKNDVKNIDDLSIVVNNLYAKYGDTLKANFMVLDFGGQEHIWVKIPDKQTYQTCVDVARTLMVKGYTFDSAVMQLIANIDYSALDYDELTPIDDSSDDIEDLLD